MWIGSDAHRAARTLTIQNAGSPVSDEVTGTLIGDRDADPADLVAVGLCPIRAKHGQQK